MADCAPPPLTLRLFGSFEAYRGEAPVPRMRRRKDQWLLALLALRPGAEVARTWLAGTLWPDSSQPAALANLRQSLKDLRCALGPEAHRLHCPTTRTLSLDLIGAELDVREFDAAFGAGDAASLRRAVCLYRGPLLEDCAEEWVFQERQTREQAYLQALEALAAGALAADDPAEAERCLRRAIAVDPLRESTQRALMQVLAAGGSYAAALLCYRELRLLLHRELNTAPDPETQTLFQRLRSEARRLASKGSEWQGLRVRGQGSVPTGMPAPFPTPETATTLRHNLPRPLTRTIGREPEVRTVLGLLADHPLVTLIGPGGCGKSRLALEVALACAQSVSTDRPADGVWLAELAPLADPALVPQTVAATLGVREEPGLPLTETLVNSLRSRSLWLVLDNCEHLIEACARLAERLLHACPHLTVLATSREPLAVPGERSYLVPSLSTSDAVQLFLDRAATASPSFHPTEEERGVIGAICTRLDGIPLAIELAAAWAKTLPIPEIDARLDDRFRLLTRGSRTALPRHQTLRASLDWSYDLLTEKERVLLRRFAVFAGGWTLPAAEGVCGDDQRPTTNDQRGEEACVGRWSLVVGRDEILDLLTSLVEKSLVQQEGQAREGRYRMLETVRQYGHEKLQASEEAVASRDRHRDWYLTMAEQAKLDLGADHENLEAALEWSMQRGDAESALRLGEALHGFWYPRGYLREGRERLGKALALPGAEAPTAARAQALTRAGYWAFRLGDYQGARELLEGALTIGRQLGIQNRTLGALFYLGQVARYQGDYQGARSLYEEILTILRQSGDQDNPYRYWPLLRLGDLANLEGDYEGARALCEECLQFHRQMGNWYGIACSLHCLGDVARNQGDYQGARPLYEESLEIYRQLGDHADTAWPLEGLAAVARSQRDYKEARAFYIESLEIYRRSGEQQGIASGLEGLADVAAADDQPERAARLFGAAEALRGVLGAPLPPGDRARYDCCVAVTRAALGEEAFAAAWAAGRALSLNQAVDHALADGSDDTPDRTR
jgi:non-specific serine/threonine protein kinase